MKPYIAEYRSFAQLHAVALYHATEVKLTIDGVNEVLWKVMTFLRHLLPHSKPISESSCVFLG